MLVFDVLGSSDIPIDEPPVITEKDHLILRNLDNTYQSINEDNYQEAYHDATQFKGEAISLSDLVI